MLFTLFFGAQAHADTKSFSSGEIKYGDLFEVRDVVITDADFHTDDMAHLVQRRRLPMGRDLQFTAVGAETDYKVDLTLELTEVFGLNAEITGALAGDAVLHDRSYRGWGLVRKCNKQEECQEAEEVIRTSVTFFETFGEHVFHALIRLENSEFAVDPKRFVDKTKFMNGAAFPSSDSPLSKVEPDMYFFSSTDIFELNDSVDEADPNDLIYTPKRRLLQQVTVFTNCYAGQGQATYRISMGMLIDDGFFAVTGGNNAQAVRDYTTGMFNDMNTMYGTQMGVEISLQSLVLGDDSTTNGANGTPFDGTTFNEAPTRPGQKTCPSGKGPSTRLNELRAWRGQWSGNHPRNFGLWHLMTHCHPPSGTVGIAYVGALCHSFGVGLSNYLGSSSWEVLAHEVGHNFGSGHTFDRGVSGGIMDYGDGLLNGVYQFHPVHKNEVCSEISESMTRTRYSSNCWSAAEVDPAPVTAPTPRPVAPTPRPTAPTARPTNAAPDPTNRPTATPRPTTVPTPRPTFSNIGIIYKWHTSDEFSDCSVDCGTGYRTRIQECRRYVTGTAPCTVDPNNVDRAQCSTQTLNGATIDYSSCQQFSTVVTDAFCSAGCKEDDETQTCTGSGGNCGGGQCGNGKLDAGEYCDPDQDACCASDCQSWDESATQCQGQNANVDAAVMDFDKRLFLFQGDQFAVYADMDDSEPITGYPKPLSTIDGLDAAFVDGIDSAASFYDDYVFLFKGLNFVLVDLDEIAQVGTSVYSATDYLGLAQSAQFAACGQINAVLSYYWSLDLICKDITAEFRWDNGRQTGAAQLVTNKWDMGFGEDVAGGYVTAAVRNPESGMIRFYKGAWNSQWVEGSETPAVSQSPPLAGRAEEACLVDNCSVCSTTEENRCDTCNTGFKRKRKGRLCKPPRNFVDLSFDDNDYSTALMETISGGESGSADNGGWGMAGEIVPGAFGYALRTTGEQITRLQPHDFGGPVDNWKISLWWMPDTLGRQRLLTMNRDRGNGFVEQLTIDFVTESDTEPVEDDMFAIEVWLFDTRVDCYVNHPIELNTWNKIAIEFSHGMIKTSANGITHTVEMETANTDDYAADFSDWYIGESNLGVTGISGTIDKFQVSNMDVPDNAPQNSGKIATWVLVTLIGGVSLALVFLGFLFYRCYGRDKAVMSAYPAGATSGASDGSQEDELPSAPKKHDDEDDNTSIQMGAVKKVPSGGAPRPPPRGGKKRSGKAPPPPLARGLDLGLTPEKRRESWQI